MDKKIDVRTLNIRTLNLSKKFELPYFQRKMVWKKDKKQDLIFSLKKNYPIGAITLFQKEKSDDKYIIIDGLQRITTINEFIKNPTNILSWTIINREYENLIKECFELEDEKEIKKVYKHARKWYEEDFGGDIESLVRFLRVTDLIKDIDDFKIEKIYKNLASFFGIDNIDIPVIVYRGQIEDIADIFEKMNTGSIKLTKYECFGAIWSGKNADFSEKEIKEKYTALLKLQYAGIEDSIEVPINYKGYEMSIFELIIALSNQLLTNKNILNIGLKATKINIETNIKSLKKYINKDEIAHELIATLFYNKTTLINKVVDHLYEDLKYSLVLKTNLLIQIVNIFESIINEIDENTFSKERLSNYHSYYVLIALFKIQYKLNIETFEIQEIENTEYLQELKKYVLNTELIKELNWFRDENRQLSFFEEKIKELDDLVKKQNQPLKNIFK